MRKIALLTVNYNSFNDFIALYRSLEGQSIMPDIYLLDNNSPKDNKNHIISFCQIHNINLTLNKSNNWFAGGINQLLKKAYFSNYDYYFLVNPDTYITDKDFFMNLTSEAESNDIDIIGPVTLKPIQPETIFSAGGTIVPYIMLTILNYKNKSLNSLLKNVKSSIWETDFVSGGAILISSKVTSKLQLLPEEYKLYFEEVDYCLQAKKLGFRIGVSINTYIYHHDKSGSVGRFSTMYVYFMIRNYRIFAHKYINRFYLPMFYLFYFFVWIPFFTFKLMQKVGLKAISTVYSAIFNLTLY